MEVGVRWHSSVNSENQGSAAVFVAYGAASAMSKCQFSVRHLPGLALLAELFYGLNDQENSSHAGVVG
jgi:hypothetical protein